MNAGKVVIGSKDTGGGYVNLQVWFGSPNDATKGITAENVTLDSFMVTENMFTILPTCEMMIIDDGRFFGTYGIRPGDTFNIRMAPNNVTSGDEEADEPKPFIDCSFVIQTVLDIPDQQNKMYMHRIIGVYSAQAYINQVTTFPKEDTLSWPLYLKTTSAAVLQEIAEEAGLGFTAEVKPSDDSYWICCNETRGRFAERVLSHAWVGEGDAPLLYCDVDGTLHYTSIGTICTYNKTNLKFADPQSSISEDTDPKKTTTIMIGDARCLNAGGPILNMGGYVLAYSLYNPYNSEKISLFELPQYGNGGLIGSAMTTAAAILGDDADRSVSMRQKNYSRDESFLATVPNKQASEKDNVSDDVDGGMYFDEMHIHYNIAPRHNEMVRRSFFQNFIKLSVDTARQGDLYREEKYRPALGKVCKVDFSSSEMIDKIHSGNYCVAEIQHKYRRKKPYTQTITVVNDGYFGTNV